MIYIEPILLHFVTVKMNENQKLPLICIAFDDNNGMFQQENPSCHIEKVEMEWFTEN